MLNYIQKGDILDLVAPSGGYASGALVVQGTIAGVAAQTTLEGDVCAVSVSGVFEIPKAAGALAVGAKVYTDAGAAVTTTDTDTYVGKVVVAALSGDTTVQVLLCS